MARLCLRSPGGGDAGEELVVLVFRGSGWLCCGFVGWVAGGGVLVGAGLFIAFVYTLNNHLQYDDV